MQTEKIIKIAVISDLHANKLALDKALLSIEKFSPDKIFCLGDLILGGYDPNYVVSKIIELKNQMGDDFEIIQGNTDKMIAQYTPELAQMTISKFPCMGYSLVDDVQNTKEEYIDFVGNLPEKKEVLVNGLKIELVHGSPRSQSENIYPDLPLDTVEDMVKNSSADVILSGHTHLPCGYSLNSGKTVINAGSLGRSMTPDRSPVYLELTIDINSTFLAEHKIIKYDNKFVSDKIRSRGLKNINDLADMYVVK